MPQSRHPDWEPITAYVADMSYFSGKMEAYLRYKEIPFERRVVDMNVMRDEILPATGLMKVPVLRLADGRWLKDTTPMIEWLESQYPQPPVIPKDPVLRFLSKLVEDYADEWCWRAALYWRWQPQESRKLLMRRIGHEVLDDFPAPNWLAGWYYGRRQMATYLSGDGLSAETEPHIKQHYLDLLDAMAADPYWEPLLAGFTAQLTGTMTGSTSVSCKPTAVPPGPAPSSSTRGQVLTGHRPPVSSQDLTPSRARSLRNRSRVKAMANRSCAQTSPISSRIVCV